MKNTTLYSGINLTAGASSVIPLQLTAWQQNAVPAAGKYMVVRSECDVISRHPFPRHDSDLHIRASDPHRLPLIYLEKFVLFWERESKEFFF
jgi:hypothetical protein